LHPEQYGTDSSCLFAASQKGCVISGFIPAVGTGFAYSLVTMNLLFELHRVGYRVSSDPRTSVHIVLA
jgi:hypothetical protein